MGNTDASAKKDKAIHYNENAEKYAESGKVDAAARKAVEALDDETEAIELQKAETLGKSHANRPKLDAPPGGSSAKPTPKKELG